MATHAQLVGFNAHELLKLRDMFYKNNINNMDEFENWISHGCNHQWKECTRTILVGEAFDKVVYHRCTKCLCEKENK